MRKENYEERCVLMEDERPFAFNSNGSNSEEYVERPSISRETPLPCQCPEIIRKAAKIQGRSCQAVFRRAYLGLGYPESFSRAVFAQFAISQDKNKLIPVPVRNYCKLVHEIPTNENTPVREKCMGCYLTGVGLNGFVNSYSLIHPEVTADTLIEHSKKEIHPTLPVIEEELSEEDRIWIELVKSGALEDDDSRFDTLIYGSDPDDF
jgi:hypothetical protein